jgi:hypothetical protein
VLAFELASEQRLTVATRKAREPGYAGGLAAKEWLLAHERRLASSPGELSEGVTPA